MIRGSSSIPAWMEMCGVPSTSGKGEKINEAAFKALIRAAVAANSAAHAQRAAKKK
jgi:hypothetical protein